MALGFLGSATLFGGTEPEHDHRIYRPVRELPEQVVVPAGELSLYYLSNERSPRAERVYLINRTDRPIAVEENQAPTILKLETENASGEWVRAQTHAFSSCVLLGPDAPPLGPGEFATFPAYRPGYGRRARVRYRIYGDRIPLVSNVAIGLVNDAEIRISETDSLGLSLASLSLARDVAIGSRRVPNQLDINPPRVTAVRRIAELAKSRRSARLVLEEIARGEVADPERPLDSPVFWAQLLLRQLE